MFFLNRLLLLPPWYTLSSTVHDVKMVMKKCDILCFSAFCGCDQSHALFQCSQLSPLSSRYNFPPFLMPFTVSSSGLHITPSAELEELPGHWVGEVERAEGGLWQQFGVARSIWGCRKTALGCSAQAVPWGTHRYNEVLLVAAAASPWSEQAPRSSSRAPSLISHISPWASQLWHNAPEPSAVPVPELSYAQMRVASPVSGPKCPRAEQGKGPHFLAEAWEQFLLRNDFHLEHISYGWCCWGEAALLKAASASYLWAISGGCAKLGSWVLPCGLRSLGDLFLCWEGLPDCKCKVSPTFLSLPLPFASFHRKAIIVSSVS